MERLLDGEQEPRGARAAQVAEAPRVHLPHDRGDDERPPPADGEHQLRLPEAHVRDEEGQGGAGVPDEDGEGVEANLGGRAAHRALVLVADLNGVIK